MRGLEAGLYHNTRPKTVWCYKAGGRRTGLLPALIWQQLWHVRGKGCDKRSKSLSSGNSFGFVFLKAALYLQLADNEIEVEMDRPPTGFSLTNRTVSGISYGFAVPGHGSDGSGKRKVQNRGNRI